MSRDLLEYEDLDGEDGAGGYDRAARAYAHEWGSHVITRKGFRERRIPWFASDSDELMQRVMLGKYLREWRVAQRFWRESWSAREIADAEDMSIGAVEQLLRRIEARHPKP